MQERLIDVSGPAVPVVIVELRRFCTPLMRCPAMCTVLPQQSHSAGFGGFNRINRHLDDPPSNQGRKNDPAPPLYSMHELNSSNICYTITASRSPPPEFGVRLTFRIHIHLD